MSKDDKKIYNINDLRPADKVKGYPRDLNNYFKRLTEILPGLLDIIFLSSPIIACLLNQERLFMYFINILACYWIYRSIYYIYGIYKGTKYYQRDMNIDYYKLIKNKYPLAYKKLKYVLIYPLYQEELKTINSSIDGWLNSDIDAKKIIIVFAIEQKNEQENIAKFNTIKKKYPEVEMTMFVHPHTPGELKGVKGPNINYATRKFVEKLMSRGERLEDYLLFTFDSDQIPHRKYMSAITYKFLSNKKNNCYNKFYTSACTTFNNNLYSVPVLSRLLSESLTLTVMGNWALKKFNLISPDSWSSYAVSLKTVHDVGYWQPDVESDDTHFFYNSLLHYNGDFQGIEVYIPTFNNAVEDYKSLFKQQYRWGWGITVFPITLAGFFSKNNKTSLFFKNIKSVFPLIRNILTNNIPFMIVLGFPLLNLLRTIFHPIPIMIHDAVSETFVIGFPLLNFFIGVPNLYDFNIIIGFLLIIIFLFNIPLIYFRRRIMPVPINYSLKDNIKDILEFLLVVVNLLTFNFLPYLIPRILLLLGYRPKKFK